MKNFKILSIFFLLLYFSSFGLINAQETFLAPEFKLHDLNDKEFSLSSYKDKKPVLLFFWTTWCPLCRSQIKLLNRKYPQLSQENLEILCINVGESKEKIESFLKKNYLAWPVLLDENMLVAYTFDIVGLPTYVLIDKEGYIVFIDNYFPFQDYKAILSKE